jgi:hypothetical protein
MRQSLRVALVSAVFAAPLSFLVLAACGRSSDETCTDFHTCPPSPVATVEAAVDAGPSGLQLAAPCLDAVAAVYATPTSLAAANGSVLSCAKDTDISMADLMTRLAQDTSSDPQPSTNLGIGAGGITSGAHVYRIAYQTTRADPGALAGFVTAKVFIPDTPRALSLPVIVAVPESHGQSVACIPSQENSWSLGDDSGTTPENGDYDALTLPLVGAGFVVIAPDVPRFVEPLSDSGTDAAPSSSGNDAGDGGDAEAGVPGSGFAIGGYLDAQDEAQATLDAARALASMFSSGMNGKTALVGHTQGAHAVLSAVAFQPSYAPDVQLSAVATYAPFWLTMDVWGFLLNQDPQVASTPAMTAMSVWYHYSHGELLDGVGHGLDVFAAAAKTSVLDFVHNDCWGQWSGLGSSTESVDALYDPNFVSYVGFAAALNGPCFSSTQCSTWLARYAADRPSLSGRHVPLLIAYGGSDQTLTPDSLECVLDRFRNEDGIGYSLCVAPGVGNAGILRAKSGYVTGWLGAQTLGETATETCTDGEGSLFPDAGDGGDASAAPACPASPKN